MNLSVVEGRLGELISGPTKDNRLHPCSVISEHVCPHHDAGEVQECAVCGRGLADAVGVPKVRSEHVGAAILGHGGEPHGGLTDEGERTHLHHVEAGQGAADGAADEAEVMVLWQPVHEGGGAGYLHVGSGAANPSLLIST
jgi:hypothetical protein